jgi:hypothetical protein
MEKARDSASVERLKTLKTAAQEIESLIKEGK